MPLTLCRCQPIHASNPLSLATFAPFFELYDQLNNPIYLRQISQQVNERVLNERSDPEAMIYCVLRVLRISEKEMREMVEVMDDGRRWEMVKAVLEGRMRGKTAVEAIRVDIPGNYPH